MKVYVYYTYSEGQLLASEDPDARDTAVVVGAEQNNAGKGILSQFVQALEHAWKSQRGICNMQGVLSQHCFPVFATKR